jgi:hypothetical protein
MDRLERRMLLAKMNSSVTKNAPSMRHTRTNCAGDFGALLMRPSEVLLNFDFIGINLEL